MATKIFEVQQKIFSVLEKDKNLNKVIKGIFDYVPEKTKSPYVVFGEMTSNTSDTKTGTGETLTFTIDIWSESKGRKESVSILNLIEEAFEVELVLDSAFLIEQKVTTRSVVQHDMTYYHAYLDFEITIDWEEN